MELPMQDIVTRCVVREGRATLDVCYICDYYRGMSGDNLFCSVNESEENQIPRVRVFVPGTSYGLKGLFSKKRHITTTRYNDFEVLGRVVRTKDDRIAVQVSDNTYNYGNNFIELKPFVIMGGSAATTLRILDRKIGVPEFFRRKRVFSDIYDGEIEFVWLYEPTNENVKEVIDVGRYSTIGERRKNIYLMTRDHPGANWKYIIEPPYAGADNRLITMDALETRNEQRYRALSRDTLIERNIGRLMESEPELCGNCGYPVADCNCCPNCGYDSSRCECCEECRRNPCRCVCEGCGERRILCTCD